MTEEQVLHWIHSTELFGSVLGLASIRELLKRLGNPQKKVRMIHVAGTNGKGSVCAMLASVLTEEGYRTGLYTSPYVEEFRERICIDGEMISSSNLAECGMKVKQACETMTKDGLSHPTEFELVTALGFLYFAQQKCDFVVLEVGLGGRLDATNVIDPPLLAVITSIDYDHTERLGNTLEKIAYEKCGIIKPGSIVVSSPGQQEEVLQVMNQRAKEEHISLFIAPEPKEIKATLEQTMFEWNREQYSLPLLGGYQAQNGATALEAIERLREASVAISNRAVMEGFRKVRHKARMELIRPGLLIDGGHNLSGIKALCDFVRQAKEKGRILIVAGMLEDKDYQACASLLRKLADVLISTQSDSPRKLEAEAFAQCAKADLCEKDPVKAVELALNQKQQDDLIVACGSFTLAGPIRSKFLKK